MRIVFVIEKLSGFGGIEHILTDRMNYLVTHTQHEVVLLLIWQDSAPMKYTLHPNVKVVRLNVPQIPKLIFPKLYALYKFNKAIKDLSPDVVDYIWVMGAFLATFTSWRGYSIFESHQPLVTMRHKKIIKKAARRVDSVVCLTDSDARSFMNINAKQVDVIPNFTTLITKSSPDYSSRRVVYVGRNSPEKDIPRLHRLWQSVSRIHPDWTLAIHHNTQDVVQAYLSGSILVMTSKMEGFPLVLLEAISCGLPVVAFDCPCGPADIIEDGKTGYLIPYTDDQVFIEKLTVLMDDEVMRRTMGKAAKEASRKYQPNHIMSLWLKYFSEIYTSLDR